MKIGRVVFLFTVCFLGAAAFLPQSGHAQTTTVRITVNAPPDFDLLADGAQPAISCMKQASPFDIYTQQLAAAGAGIYISEISVPADFYYNCALASPIEGLDCNYSTMVLAAQGQVTEGTLVFQAYDADITFQLVTQSAGGYVPFALPEGNPEAGVFCLDSDFEMSYSAAVKTGATSAIVKLPGGKDYYCQMGMIDNYGSAMQLLSPGPDGHASGQIVLFPFDASAKVHLVDQNGQEVITSIHTYLYCNSPELQFGFPPVRIDAGNSYGTIRLSGGHSYACGITGIPLYTSVDQPTFFLGESELHKDVNLTLAALSDDLIVHLIKADGSPYTVSEGEFVYANCQRSSGLFFSQQIQSGESQTDIKVMAGDFSCYASIPGQAVRTGSVTVTGGIPADLTLPIIEKSAGVHVRLEDQYSQLLTVLPGTTVAAWPQNIGVIDWSWGPLSDGQASIPLAPEVAYSVLVQNPSSGCSLPVRGSDQQYYIFRCKAEEVRAIGTEVKELPVTVHRSDASIRVSVLRSNGTPMSGVWVQAVETQQSAGASYPLISSALTGADGLAAIPSVSSKTFDVSLLTVDRRAGMPPPAVPVTLTAGETKEVTLKFEAIDFQLHIIAQPQSLDHGTFYCYAYDDAGHMSVNEAGVALGQTLTLSLLSASSWHIGCSGANESVYFSTDEFIYSPPEGQSSDTITINQTAQPMHLTATAAMHSMGSLPSFHIDGQAFSSSLPVSPASAGAVNPKDGIEVRMPSGTLDSSGTLTAANATSLSANELHEPLHDTAVTITVRDGNGNDLSISQGKTYSVVITISAREMDGLDPASVQGARYDASTGSYSSEPIQLESINDAFRYTLTVSRAGTYALLKPRASNQGPPPQPTLSPTPAAPEEPTISPAPLPKQLPAAPFKLSLKIIKGRFQISWQAPSKGEAADSYRLTMFRGKQKIAGTNLGRNTRSYVWKKAQAGSFTVKIIAVNSAGSSKAAQKAFRLSGPPGRLRLR